MLILGAGGPVRKHGCFYKPIFSTFKTLLVVAKQSVMDATSIIFHITFSIFIYHQYPYAYYNCKYFQFEKAV